MARKNRVSNESSAYHIYARSNNRTSFGLHLDELWQIYSDYLYFLGKAYKVNIHAFSLMPNHFHLLCSFPENNISQALRYFMSETSRSINLKRSSVNHVYGGRFKSTQIFTAEYFSVAYKYVLQNPLRAKMTEDLSRYPYTTYSGALGYKLLIIPKVRCMQGLSYLVPECFVEQHEWLHQSLEDKDLEVVRQCMKKRVFKPAKERGTGREFLFNI